jgi:hypothetical protein
VWRTAGLARVPVRVVAASVAGYFLRGGSSEKARPEPGFLGSSASDLFPAKRILETTDGVLHFARRLVGLAFGFELGIARHLADRFLDGALGLPGHPFDSILIHLLAFHCRG